jgi:tetratricopeptide (TPR) repeat protein
MRRRWLAAIIVLVACSFVAVASAQSAGEADARASFERGRVLYDSGEFVQAAQAFERAYELSGRDALLYNIYLAHRDANQPAQAAQALRDYLAKVPNIENRAQLEARLAALEQGLAREREQREREERQASERAAAQSHVQAAASVESEPPPQAPSGRSPKFIAAVSLLSAGGAMMLTSVVTGLMASAKEGDLEDECPQRVCDANSRALRDSGLRLARTTDALLFGGLAIAATGGVLWWLDARGGERQAERAHAPKARVEMPRVAAACSGQGCVMAASLRF